MQDTVGRKSAPGNRNRSPGKHTFFNMLAPLILTVLFVRQGLLAR